MQTLDRNSVGFGNFGENNEIVDLSRAAHNLSVPSLYEAAIAHKEGVIAEGGPLVVATGKYTGRSPKDKFIVREPGSQEHVDWKANVPFDPDKFDALEQRVKDYLADRKVYVQDLFVAAHPKYRLPIRVISEYAWHSIFVNNLFIRPTAEERKDFKPAFTVVDAANFKAVPERDGTRSETFILLNFAKNMVLIGGTEYAGEMKKSVFTLLNYLLPLQNVMSMHCSCNYGEEGDVAIFFGLSGTGKTTLSADPERTLIGDDEHGWGYDGVFNFEGGCYAKVIKLNPTAEPEIFNTTRRFGTILENVVYNPETRQLDLDSEELTENTRAAYPLEFIPNMDLKGYTGHPKNIILLTADAFGVLPPVSKLTQEQAMYHFLSGFTAKLAGTERGVTEPQATFSTCFGSPFMVHHPSVYAELLGKKIEEHGVKCWLVNTGWTGGPYGVGSRMSIKYTRAIIRATLKGELDNVDYEIDPVFGLAIPKSCPGVPAEVLNPRTTWSSGEAYDAKAKEVAQMFAKNFEQYKDYVSEGVRKAGPSL
ncbi:MAG TPA: phosphoenolpyruvate carboxykinase [Chloroflexia bacterium]|nr:phosphoenolpyruvate carboxykinase [Chloroflexia bacterium]